MRGRSRRMRRPTGEESMVLRIRGRMEAVEVVSPRVAIRSSGGRQSGRRD